MSLLRQNRSVGVAMLVVLLAELVAPGVASSLTSGPSAPEFASFEPIGTTGMVNEFTGGFTYNLPLLEVPGPNGSGYPISLAYHSGAALEEDASWVGFGWTLNPGAINRSVRGFPDDFNKEPVEYLNRTMRNETFMIGTVASLQAFSKTLFSFDVANRWNSYTGYSVSTGFAIDLQGLGSISVRTQNGVSKYSAVLNWGALFEVALRDLTAAALKTRELAEDQTQQELDELSEQQADVAGDVYNYMANYISSSFYTKTAPSTATSYGGASYAINFGATVTFDPAPFVVGIHGGVRGSYSWQRPEQITVRDAYGYLYDGGASLDDDFSDYGTEREQPYTTRDRFLHGVYANYDQFACTAQGVMGSLRLHHRRPGFYGPNSTTSTIGQFGVGVELAFGPGKLAAGASVALGANVYGQLPVTSDANLVALRHETVGEWNNGRAVMRFANDKADNILYSATTKPEAISTVKSGLGVMPDLYARVNNWAVGDSLKRLRQSSSTTFRTNSEITRYASAVAGIQYYAFTSKHAKSEAHLVRTEPAIEDGIGEISVRNTSGMMYVFGLPVYCRNELQYTFVGESAGSEVHPNDGRVYGYKKWWDGNTYVNGFNRPAPYAASFLLTEVRTPDYIDRTHDGPTVDDFGGYTSFVYKRAAGTLKKESDRNGKQWYKWRFPYQGYNFDPGKLSLPHDNRATVSMGERESYYLQAIETRTHTALFITNLTDTTVTIDGEPVRLQGSGKQRNDAYEAYNTGDMQADEEVCGSGAGHNYVVNTALDRDSAVRFTNQNRNVGGRKPGNFAKATNGWIDSNSVARPNKSQYLERIVLLSRESDGDGFTEIVKTVNLEYDYELMSRRQIWPWVQNTKWSERERKLVDEPIKSNWDTIYSINGLLNSAVILTQQDLYANHVGSRLASHRHGKLTLKRVWTDYGSVKSAQISPYEFQYTYRNEKSQPHPAELQSIGHYDSLRMFDNQFTNAALSTAEKVDSASQVHQNPEYQPFHIDAWGSYRKNGATRNSRLQSHLDQSMSSGDSQFDPAAWQLKIIRLPSGGQIHVQYEQNSYSYVQDQPAMALVPLQSAAGNLYTLDTTALEGRSVDDVKKAIRGLIAKGERFAFKFLYPVTDCSIDPNAEVSPDSRMEYIWGYANAELVEPSPPTEIRLRLVGSPTAQQALAEFIVNQNNTFSRCVSGVVMTENKLGEKNYKKQETWNSLADAGSSISSAASARSSWILAQSSPILKRSYIRIPCLWKYGGGVRVKRLFLYDKGVENGRAGIYGSEYDYTRIEDGVVRSSGVATNEPGVIREENALVRFVVGRHEQTWDEKLAAGEDIEQFEGPFCMSAFPGPSIGYGRVVVRNIVSTESTPGFTVSEFNTAREFPTTEAWTQLKTGGEGMIPPIPSTFLTVRQAHYAASQGFTVTQNQMHGTIKRVRKCAGTYTSDEDSWVVVESMEHEYFAPGEAVPVLVQDGPATKIVSKQLGTTMDLCVETRRVFDINGDITLPFDVGLVFPFFVFGHAAPPTANLSDQIFEFGVVTKVVSHAVFERKVTVTRDGMTFSTENVAFDEATGNPVVTLFVDDQDGNADGSGAVVGGTLSYSLPAWTMYPSLGASSFNEGIQVSGLVAEDSLGYTFTPDTISVLPFFNPGDLVHLWRNGDVNAYAHVDVVSSGSVHLVTAYGNSGTVTGAVRATIVRSGRKNTLSASAATVLRHGANAAENGNIVWSSHKVLKATATTYTDDWDFTSLVDAPTFATEQTNVYERGVKGRWRPNGSYVYRSTTDGVLSGAHSGRAGRASSTFAQFPFSNPSSRDTLAWVRTAHVVNYNQHGDAVFERDALGIPSCAVFGYGASMPVIIAKNAEHGAAAFNSFEDSDLGNATVAHTGKKSRSLNTTADSVFALNVASRVQNSGLMVRAWIRPDASSTCALSIGGTSVGSPQTIATVAGWKLLEWTVSANTGPLTSTGIKAVTFSRTGGTTLYIDDVRMQPLNSEATCYVYDAATLKLIAQFDDQHFAALYKYDAQGQLKRKDRETERGIFPLQEMHQNTPAIAYSAEVPSFGSLPRVASPWEQSGFNILDAVEEMINGTPSRINGKVDMLQLNVNPERLRLQLFDGPQREVNIDSLMRAKQIKSSDTSKGNGRGPRGTH